MLTKIDKEVHLLLSWEWCMFEDKTIDSASGYFRDFFSLFPHITSALSLRVVNHEK